MTGYVCDPERNTACSKELCFERGGPCGVTDNPAFALRDFFGIPIRLIDEEAGSGHQ